MKLSSHTLIRSHITLLTHSDTLSTPLLYSVTIKTLLTDYLSHTTCLPDWFSSLRRIPPGSSSKPYVSYNPPSPLPVYLPPTTLPITNTMSFKSLHFNLMGLTCQSCVKTLTSALTTAFPSVEVTVTLKTCTLTGFDCPLPEAVIEEIDDVVSFCFF